MRRIFVFFIFLILSTAQAEPVINIDFKHYDIFPTSIGDFRREMDKRSPIRRYGKTYKGHTRWKVKWNYEWYKKDGICNITSVSTKLNVTYTMPRLAARHEVPEPVYQYFFDYYTKLFEHEQGHMNSGLCAARDIEKAILNFGSFKSCTRLSNAATAVGRKIIKQYGKLDSEYDRITDHGKTQSHLSGSSSSSADCSLSANM